VLVWKCRVSDMRPGIKKVIWALCGLAAAGAILAMAGGNSPMTAVEALLVILVVLFVVRQMKR